MQLGKNDTDKLVELIKTGDEGAREVLYDTYAPLFYGMIRRLVPGRSETDDVLLKSFVVIFSEINQYNSTGSLFAWMYTIVLKEILRWHESHHAD